MSGIAGTFDPTGRPVDRELFARVVSRIAYRGPDGVRTWHAPGVAMAHARFVRTPDAVFDCQPLHDAASQTCVTFDGRLDNREELAADLGLQLSDHTCDVALAAAGYARWGAEAAVRLLGDFTVAVWEGPQRRLYLARDIMGMRPLFYRQVNGAWWWASDQRALLEIGIPPVNEGYLGEHLSVRITSTDETIYEGIHRLPMGHALAIRGSDVRRFRYWQPNPDRQVRHRHVTEYEEEFRALLKEAVRVRLRARGGVALMLSGGIDSSSIAAQIAALREEGAANAAQIKAFSLTIPGSPHCEGPVIDQVLAQVALPSEVHSLQKPGEDVFARDAAASLDLPEVANSIVHRSLRRAAGDDGRSVVLRGMGGDEWFDTSYGELSDFIRSGRLIASARWLSSMARAPGPFALPDVARQGAWIAMPDGLKRMIRRGLRRTPVPEWIEPSFARQHNLAERLRRAPESIAFDSIAQGDMFAAATGGEASFRTDHEERLHATFGLELRHPLMDRRLIEFGLALPPHLRCDRGVSKTILRRAMIGALPATVTGMPPASDYSFLAVDVLARLGGRRRILASRPMARGWLRANVIDQLYRRMENGVSRHMWPMSSVAAIDFWLRALESAQAMEDHGTRLSTAV